MPTKKNQQPLLYIKQPTFEKLTAPMQQFFISRKPNPKQSESQETVEVNNATEIERLDEIKNENLLETKTTMGKEENLAPIVEDTGEPKVMEFILEGILSPRVDEDSIVKEVLDDTRFAQIEENTVDHTVELKRKKSAILEEKESNEDESVNFYGKYDEKKEEKNRPHFNELSLVNKLDELQKIPINVVKILYQIVTEEQRFNGYFLSSKKDGILLQPKNSEQTVKIPEHKIVDIKMIGF